MRNLILSTAIVVMGLALYGCQKKATSEPTVTTPVKEKTAPKEPDYTKFGALKKATFDVTLPFFAGTAVKNDVPCFVQSTDIKATTADDRLQHYIEKNIDDVTATVMDWFLWELNPDLVKPEVTKNWKISFDDMVTKELSAENLRFAEEPKCFTKGGWLPKNHHLITSVYGARKIKFESSVPLKENMRKAIKSAAAGKDIEMTTDSLGDDPKNPEPVSEWELTFKKPIYFGAKEIPKRMWRKEDNKYDCELIFVTGAKQKPATPECPEYRESKFSFAIVKGEEKPVRVTVATKGKKKIVPIFWDETVKLRVNDRIYLWMKAEKVEVGSRLRINSVVLNPVPIPGENLEEEEEEYESSNDEDAQNTKGDSKKPSKSDNPIDSYLYR